MDVLKRARRQSQDRKRLYCEEQPWLDIRASSADAAGGSRTTAAFHLASSSPAICGQTKALLQSALAEKRVQKIPTGDLDAACYRAADEKKTW